jgi:hypothetical protein
MNRIGSAAWSRILAATLLVLVSIGSQGIKAASIATETHTVFIRFEPRSHQLSSEATVTVMTFLDKIRRRSPCWIDMFFLTGHVLPAEGGPGNQVALAILRERAVERYLLGQAIPESALYSVVTRDGGLIPGSERSLAGVELEVLARIPMETCPNYPHPSGLPFPAPSQ